MAIGRPRAILFDLDETLSDRAASMLPYALRLRADFAHALAPIAVSAIAASLRAADGNGYRGREAVTSDILQLLPWTSAPDGALLSEHWLQWFPASTLARAGLIEMLEALRTSDIALGVITNGAARGQQAKLKRLGVSRYFSSVTISETAGFQKPDARIFALALRELGCEPREAWYVGDHPINDMIGARDAGLRPIWLRGIHPWPTEHIEPADQIDGLGELLSLLDAAE